MTTSRRVADRKVARFERSITKKAKKGFKFPTVPVLIGCFVFIIVGSCLFQIIRLAQRSGNVA